MGGFVILDMDCKEVVWAGRYYGPGQTNNEAKSFAIQDALQCLSKLIQERPALRHPIQVFGDSQLMIQFPHTSLQAAVVPIHILGN